MPQSYIRIVLSLLMFAFSSTAIGKTLEGVAMADEIEVGGKKLLLNGLGLREATFMKVDVYVAGLYLESKSSSPATIVNSETSKRLTLKFVRDVERVKLTEAMLVGFEQNGRGVGTLAAKITTLNTWMTDMKKGQALTFDFAADGSTTVFINNNRKGSLKGRSFSQGLLAIWLGPNPPNAGLKKGLLGK